MEDQVETFIGVTGASEETALELLHAHNGDLNTAINFFLEHGAQTPAPVPSDLPVPPPPAPVVADVNSEEDEPVVPLMRRRVSRPTATHSQSSVNPFRAPGLPAYGVGGSGAPGYESPFDDEPLPAPQRFGLGRESALIGTPGVNTGAAGGQTAGEMQFEHHDVEEEMMKAALEASMKEPGTEGAGVTAGGDDDLEMAISQSLKTAEQEQARAPPPTLLDDLGAELFPPVAVPRVGPLGRGPTANGVSGRSSTREIPIEGFEDEEDRGGSGQARRNSRKAGSPNPNGRIAGVGGSRGSSRRASPSPEPGSGREGRQSSRSSRRRPSSEERAAELMEDVNAFMGRAGVNVGGNRPGPNRQAVPMGSWPPRVPARDSDGDEEQTEAEAAVAAARAGALGGARPAEELDPLEGLTAEEREEAHMLEAAMMGIPYEARPGRPAPAYNSVAGPAYRPVVPAGGYDDMDMDDEYGAYRAPRELDPMVQAQREIRNQQDEEYLASLAADREKELKAAAEAEERTQREREERRQREEELERARLEARARLQAEEELQLHLAEKASTLPEEPPAGEPGVVTVMVRMPDGSRKARRLRSSDPVQVLFDFIDVDNSFKPGSYRLINSFPRRVLEAKACIGKTLQDVGLTSKQEALFLEQ